MISKTKIILPTDDDEIKLVLSKACDLYNRAFTTSKSFYTKFLSPLEAATIRQRFPQNEICIKFFGGYDDAERCMCAFYTDEYDLFYPLVALKLKPKSKNASLTHRDYLGSVLSLGIKRETLGDIIIRNEDTVMFCTDDMADYIADNLFKIGGTGVAITKEYMVDNLEIQREFQTVSATVSSLRCDCVIASALNLSRGKALELIDRGLATHNYEIIKSSHKLVADGDTLSVRGHGKFKVQTSGNLTKKGRIHINILKYI